MSYCMLRVLGDEFKSVAFVESTQLTPWSTFTKGEPSRDRDKIPQTSGFICEVGLGSLDNQVEMAIDFLVKHEPDLARLSSITEIESCYVDFAHTCRLDDQSALIQRDYLPPQLLMLAGKLGIGICLSLSAPIERT